MWLFGTCCRLPSIPLDPDLVVESEAGQASGYASMQKLLALAEPPTAIFAHNDVLAIGRDQRDLPCWVDMPHDISIVGYDDTIQAAYFNPPLTLSNCPLPRWGVGRKNDFRTG